MEVYRIRNDELYHHGIKGQRWGVRRYQNADGSLTAQGRKRYGFDDAGNLSKKGQKHLYKDVKKDIRNEERLNREYYTNYRQKTEKEKNLITIKQLNTQGNRHGKIDEALKDKISDKEKKQLERLIKKQNSLDVDIDEAEYDTPKYRRLVNQAYDNDAELSNMYTRIGERVAGKYLDKKLSGSKFWGTEYTMKDEIANRIWNQTMDDIMKKEGW